MWKNDDSKCVEQVNKTERQRYALISTHQVFVDAAEHVGVKVSLAEVLEHGYCVETRLAAVDRDVAVAAVHRPQAARRRHAVADTDLLLFLLLLVQQGLARPAAAALLGVAVVRVGAGAVRVGALDVPARPSVQRVAELA